MTRRGSILSVAQVFVPSTYDWVFLALFLTLSVTRGALHSKDRGLQLQLPGLFPPPNLTEAPNRLRIDARFFSKLVRHQLLLAKKCDENISHALLLLIIIMRSSDSAATPLKPWRRLRSFRRELDSKNLTFIVRYCYKQGIVRYLQITILTNVGKPDHFCFYHCIRSCVVCGRDIGQSTPAATKRCPETGLGRILVISQHPGAQKNGRSREIRASIWLQLRWNFAGSSTRKQI